jgi:hypothetical protein
MGNIATIQSRGAVQGGLVARVPEPAPIGAMLARAGDDLIEASIENQRRQRIDALAVARSQALQQYDQLGADLAQNPDIDARPGLFDQHAKALDSQIVGSAPDVARDDVQRMLMDIGTAHRLQVMAEVRAGRKSRALASLDDSIGQVSDIASRTADPEGRFLLIQQAGHAIDDAYLGGWITPEQRRAAFDGARDKIQAAALTRLATDDPAAALQGLEKGAFDGLDPNRAAQMRASITARLQAMETSGHSQLNRAVTDVEQVAATGTPAAAAPAVRAQVSQVRNPAVRAELTARLDRAEAQQRAMAGFATQPPAARAAIITTAEENFRTRGASDKEQLDFLGRLKAIDKTDLDGIARQVDDAAPLIAAGHHIVGEDLLAVTAGGTPSEAKLAAAFQTRARLETPQAGKPPLAEPPAVTPDQAKAIDQMKAADHAQRELYDKNPLDAAYANRIIGQQDDQLDLTDGDAVQARIRDAELAGAAGGVRPAYLQPEQARREAHAIDESEPEEALQRVLAIDQAWGDRAPAVFAQMGHTSEQAALAGAYVERGAVRTARDLLVGNRLLKDKDPNGLGRAALRDATDETIGQALLGRPDRRGPMLDTVAALYAARVPGKLDGDKVNEDVLAKAIDDAAGAITMPDGTVYGGIADFNGRPVVVPATVPKDKFADFIDAATAADLQAISLGANLPHTPDGKTFTAEMLRDAWLVPADEGQYWISYTDPNGDLGPNFVLGRNFPDPRPYKLDFEALRKALTARGAQP